VKSKQYIPGFKYNIDIKLLTPQAIEQGKKKLHITKRDTFLDKIVNEQKLRYIPGPGAHNVILTEK